MLFSQKKILMMGVINLTPNSFSDAGEIISPDNLRLKVKEASNIDIFDIGAESTAPFNSSISAVEEWSRLHPYLELFKSFDKPLSFDTYHPETIDKLSFEFKNHPYPIIWNDVSGKWDQYVEKFLHQSSFYYYVFSHNLSPARNLTGEHMKYLSLKENDFFLKEVSEYFLSKKHPKVIFDPCFGFSKSYEQNWYLIDHFKDLLHQVDHSMWLIGISRKSFLRKKWGLSELNSQSKKILDQNHDQLIEQMISSSQNSFIIRKHF